MAQPSFRDVFSEFSTRLQGSPFLVAHNAAFDARVLHACCRRARLRAPRIPFVCSAEVARTVLGISPAGLASVCERLGIHLDHHDALSDAEAAARIVAHAQIRGWRPPDHVRRGRRV